MASVVSQMRPSSVGVVADSPPTANISDEQPQQQVEQQAEQEDGQQSEQQGEQQDG